MTKKINKEQKGNFRISTNNISDLPEKEQRDIISKHRRFTGLGNYIHIIAANYGITASVVLYRIVFWTKYNERTKNIKVYADGKYWFYQSLDKFVEELFFEFSRSCIYDALQLLLELGFIEVRNGKNNNQPNTKWYCPTQKLYDFLDWETIKAINSQVEYALNKKNNNNQNNNNRNNNHNRNNYNNHRNNFRNNQTSEAFNQGVHYDNVPKSFKK